MLPASESARLPRKSHQSSNADLEVIEADLHRTDFAMSLSQSALLREESIKDAVQQILTTMSEQLSIGYFQGMNFVVVALMRITSNAELAKTLALKLFSNDNFAKALTDCKTSIDLCSELRVFLWTYLPRLSQAMVRVGVETEFFAQNWFMTLMFLNQNDMGSSRRKEQNLSR